MRTSTPPRTVVEFMDVPESTLAHKALEVHVNGSPVLVADDGARVELRRNPTGGPALTVVVLELLPTEVHFHRGRPACGCDLTGPTPPAVHIVDNHDGVS